MASKVEFLVIIILIIAISGLNYEDKEKYYYNSEIPEDYYIRSNTNWGNLGCYGLEKLVQNGFVTPYQEDEFDCSEMSAYMEWYLEKYGFNASICTSQHFEGSKGHAWVMVDTKDGVVYIEATAKNNLIRRDGDYTRPEKVYESIYEIRNVEEFDWWTDDYFESEAEINPKD